MIFSHQARATRIRVILRKFRFSPILYLVQPRILAGRNSHRSLAPHPPCRARLFLNGIYLLPYVLQSVFGHKRLSEMASAKFPLKAVALDLDGTTLNNDHEVSDKNRSVLHRLSAAGITICIATGRTTASALNYIRDLGLPQETVPTVAFNGAYGCIVNVNENQITTLSTNPVPESLSRLLIQLAEDMGLVLQYYNGETGDVYAVPLNDTHRMLLHRYATLTSRPQVFVSSYEEVITLCLSPKILIVTEDPDALLAESYRRFPNGIFHMIKGSPDPYFVEYLLPGIDKSSCLAEVTAKINIDLKSVVAFGDGDNDKEMLRECGIGVAMNNAKALAKEHADVVLEHTNHEDGVGRYLEELINEGKFGIIK